MNAQVFFTSLKKLLDSRPKTEADIVNSEGCVYSNHVYDCKDLTYCFDMYASKDGVYLFDSALCVHSADSDYIVECDSCYECVDIYKSYDCKYVEKSREMRNCSFCYDCRNLENCFGCVQLNNRSYCIFNRQLNENEYREAVKKYEALPASKVLEILNELKKQFPLAPAAADHNVNSPYGSYVYYCKNCYMCFDAAQSEDCMYNYDSFYNKVCMDLTYSARHNENSFQLIESRRMNNCSYAIDSISCQDSLYLFNCKNVKNSFGCVGLQHKEYCILNRQFSKEDYEKVLPAIKKAVLDSNTGWDGMTY